MKNPLKRFTRFFVRGKKFNIAAARPAMANPREDDDDNRNQLSGAFVVVLLLHFIAIVGVFAFARIKEKNRAQALPDSPVQTTATKANAAKPAAPKPAAPVATAAPTPVAPAAPAHEPVKASQSGQLTHIVKVGEKLERIAFAYNVGLPDLAAANHLKNKDDIRTGQALTIPEGRAPAKVSPAADIKPPAPANDPKIPTKYIVKKNETVAKIAREHGCTYDELVKLNNIKDPKRIQPGQVLKLPIKTL